MRQGLAAEDSLRKIFSKMEAEKIIQLALEEKAQGNFDRAEVYFKIVTHFAPENEQGPGNSEGFIMTVSNMFWR